ncbi:hypothetical protein J6590_054828 [Homalodisca vitripennis]|nr:hypothetical protein J6590_054828 [Homalodisca vitripennis]
MVFDAVSDLSHGIWSHVRMKTSKERRGQPVVRDPHLSQLIPAQAWYLLVTSTLQESLLELSIYL